MSPTLINFTLPTNHECLHCENKLLYTLAHSGLLWQLVISHESCVDSVFDILQILQSYYFPYKVFAWFPFRMCMLQEFSTNYSNTDVENTRLGLEVTISH